MVKFVGETLLQPGQLFQHQRRLLDVARLHELPGETRKRNGRAELILYALSVSQNRERRAKHFAADRVILGYRRQILHRHPEGFQRFVVALEQRQGFTRSDPARYRIGGSVVEFENIREERQCFKRALGAVVTQHHASQQPAGHGIDRVGSSDTITD